MRALYNTKIEKIQIELLNEKEKEKKRALVSIEM